MSHLEMGHWKFHADLVGSQLKEQLVCAAWQVMTPWQKLRPDGTSGSPACSAPCVYGLMLTFPWLQGWQPGLLCQVETSKGDEDQHCCMRLSLQDWWQAPSGILAAWSKIAKWEKMGVYNSTSTQHLGLCSPSRMWRTPSPADLLT